MAFEDPDRAPERVSASIGGLVGAPSARVKGRDGLVIVVERVRADGALDYYTHHFTRRGAQRAVRRYLADGTVVGRRP